jgi:transposase
VFGHRPSAGSLAEWTRKASDALADTDRYVTDLLANETGSVHFDETGLRCEGKNRWLHSASNARLTHLAFHRRRGTEAIEEIGILPRFQGTAIHDRWKPYSQYSCSHGLCGAHLLRDCRFAWEEEKERWAGSMHGFLVETCGAVNQAREQGRSRFNGPTIERMESRYDRILKAGDRLHASKNPLPRAGKRGRRKQRFGKNLIDSLIEHKGSVLRFTRDFTVPFTNNQAERDIRMSKVKIKVSGCFRSEDGARHFCRIRGYLSTAKKQGWNLLETLTSVFLGAPLQPASA